MTRLYLAGPMTGIPQFNIPAFRDAALRLRVAGHSVLSPPERDPIDVQDAAWRSATGDPADLPDHYTPLDAALRNTRDIAQCDGLALLTGWARSAGAKHELAVANRLGIEVLRIDHWLATTPEPAEPAPEPDAAHNIQADITSEPNARTLLLREAEELVNGDRNNQYGDPRQDFRRTAQMWSAYLEHDVGPHDVAALMALLKLSRIAWSPGKRDSWADLAGYAACGWDCAEADG